MILIWFVYSVRSDVTIKKWMTQEDFHTHDIHMVLLQKEFSGLD